MAAHRCTFPDALSYAAEIAGVHIQKARGESNREIAARERHRKRIGNAARKFTALERALRQESRNRIMECERILAAPQPWSEAQWQRAKAACTLRDDFLLPEYTLLSFGRVAERARFVLADENNKASMLSTIRLAGGVYDDDGRWVEVIA